MMRPCRPLLLVPLPALAEESTVNCAEPVTQADLNFAPTGHGSWRTKI